MLQLRDYQSNLIQQTRQAFIEGYKRPCVVLACGGGKTICFAYMAQQHISKSADNYVWFLVHRRELITQTLDTFARVGVSTDRIYVGMVQSAKKIPTPPTMIIFDECHHATANTWRRIIEQYPDVPIVGLTATPARTDGAGLGEVFDKLVMGVSAEWLQANGYLSQYDYYAPKLNITLKDKGNDYDTEDIAEQFRKSKIYGKVEKYLDKNRKTIIYCPTLSYSRELAQQIGGVHFDGTTPTAERDEIVRKFKSGEIKTLLNVDLIGEGFDVPDCDCVILLRPTKSVVLYVQQSMRCLRPKGNKRAIIYDLVGNCYRHGLPTDDRVFTLNGRHNSRANAPGVLARQCNGCYRVYKGSNRICPYCGADNGKTAQQIAQDEKAELERITKLRRNERKYARTYEELVAIGEQRGYKNPSWWARCVISGRGR